MKASAVPPRADSRASFTLVEMLVAVSVLGIIVLLMAQSANLVSKASRDGTSGVDNFTKSRAMLDLIASDLQHAVIRPDLPIFQTGGILNTNGIGGFTNGAYAAILFTRIPGIPNASSVPVRNISLVSYAIVVPTNSSDKIALERSDLAILWNQGADIAFQGDLTTLAGTATPREMAPGVVGFQLSFRRADGTVSTQYTGYNAANPVVAVGVTLAVVGDQALAELTPSFLSQIQSTLTNNTPTATNNIPGVKTLWNANLTSAFYDLYPKDLATNLKTFERWIVPSQPF